MRMRKKKNLSARLEKCSSIMLSDPEAHKGSWAEVSKRLPVHLEIGCGKGRFSIETAKANPDVFFLAIEREENALLTALENALSQNIPNLLFIDGDAGRLSNIFAPREIERIYINFCDPWPPKKQAKRRLTHGNFLNVYKELLPPGGEIHFKTDNEKLFEFSLNEFSAYGFSLRNITFDLHSSGTVNIMTEYEEKFSSMGMKIFRCEAISPNS